MFVLPFTKKELNSLLYAVNYAASASDTDKEKLLPIASHLYLHLFKHERAKQIYLKVSEK
jgi:hypothetical protein